MLSIVLQYKMHTLPPHPPTKVVSILPVCTELLSLAYKKVQIQKRKERRVKINIEYSYKRWLKLSWQPLPPLSCKSNQGIVEWFAWMVWSVDLLLWKAKLKINTFSFLKHCRLVFRKWLNEAQFALYGTKTCVMIPTHHIIIWSVLI